MSGNFTLNRVRHILILALIVLPGWMSAQNLVPNPGFENLNTPPCSWITSTGGFTGAVQNWTMPSNGSTDIFSDYVATTCYGHNFSTHSSRIGQQAPHAGRVQSSILTYGAGCGYQPNYREYIQVQLTSPLVPGQDYDFEFYISLGDVSEYATNNFGVHFRTGSYFQSTCFVISLTPQFNSTTIINDASGWTKVSGTITAGAAWDHIIIGNFYSNAATSIAVNGVGTAGKNTRYYIDDVAVQPATALASAALDLDGKRETDGTVALNWSLSAENAEGSFTLQRENLSGSWENLTEFTPGSQEFGWGFKDVHPPAGTIRYRVRHTDLSGNHAISEILSIQAAEFPYALSIASHPVPAGQDVELRIAHADDSPVSAEILDINGRRIWQLDGLSLYELDGYRIPAQVFQPGVYAIRLRTVQGSLSRKLVITGN